MTSSPAPLDDRRSARMASEFMRHAIALAKRGWGHTAPNPMVGAVIVSDGESVGEGFHARLGDAHAETVALRAAGIRARGATMYVTLEPCAHQGKTPPCVDALLAAGVRQVVIGATDPNPLAAGGAARLRDAGVDVQLLSGEAADDAHELNAAYFNSFTGKRPWTTLKLAVSLDGAIADAARSSGSLTGDLARREVHRLRAGHDAIGVGMGTVLADDPQLTVRDAEAPRVPPIRVVFSRQGRLPLTSRLAQSVHEASVLVFAQSIDSAYEHLLNQLGVEVVLAPSLSHAARTLFERGCRSLLVEGGARLSGALLRESLVDRLAILQAPIILGVGSLNAFAELPSQRVTEAHRLRVIRRESLGTDLLTIFAADGH